MSSATERLIDGVALCTECGLPYSARCRCHEPKDPVRLVCVWCDASIVVEREADFLGFDIIQTCCPKCSPRPVRP